MKKSYVAYSWIYFIFAVAISIFTQLKVTTVTYFVIGSFVNILFFVGVYFCLKNISSGKIWVRIIRVTCAIVLLGFVYASYGLASMSGFHSSYCYNLVAKDFFTGKVNIHCNYPPWHTKIIGGEEARQILLDNCLSRKSEFYTLNPNYCDVYKNATSDKDWAKGPNP